MRISRYRPAITAVALSGLAACSWIQVQGISSRTRAGPDNPGVVNDSGAFRFPRPDTGAVGISTHPGSALVRRVCRANGLPRGWIATAYERAEGECPRNPPPDSTAQMAIIVELNAQPVGAVLDVCADQAVPKDWAIVYVDSTEISGRCPGAARRGGPTVRRIRRVS